MTLPREYGASADTLERAVLSLYTSVKTGLFPAEECAREGRIEIKYAPHRRDLSAGECWYWYAADGKYEDPWTDLPR